MPVLVPNLDRKGRLIRGLGAAAMAFAGLLFLFKLTVLGVVLLVSAAFVAFEAVRGWCVLRACGVKTKF